jgi:protein SCO1/2
MTMVSPPTSLFSRLGGVVVAISALLFSSAALAKAVPESEQVDRTEPLPAELRGIDVREHLNQTVAKAAAFKDEAGKPVTLSDYLDGKIPTILTLNYSRCPMLCGLELNALVTSLSQLEWTIGKEFRVVTVVLDPKETPAQASEAKARYLRQYGRDPGAAAGWHFLTGESSIQAVARSVGFSYGYNPERNEYIHPAAIMILTPGGRIARYLYGIEYHPKTMRLSLAEASEGKIGTTVDQLILYCFHYDAKEGRYTPIAMNIMRVGGGATVTVLGGFLSAYFLSESKKRKKANLATSENSLRSSQT